VAGSRFGIPALLVEEAPHGHDLLAEPLEMRTSLPRRAQIRHPSSLWFSWPVFSRSVMRASRSSIRVSTASPAFRQASTSGWPAVSVLLVGGFGIVILMHNT
jgi:hypothetical protein